MLLMILVLSISITHHQLLEGLPRILIIVQQQNELTPLLVGMRRQWLLLLVRVILFK